MRIIFISDPSLSKNQSLLGWCFIDQDKNKNKIDIDIQLIWGGTGPEGMIWNQVAHTTIQWRCFVNAALYL
jgi:hypothetical protein